MTGPMHLYTPANVAKPLTLAQLRKLVKQKGFTHAGVVKVWGFGDWCATVFKGRSSECFVSHSDKALCIGAMFAALSALPDKGAKR